MLDISKLGNSRDTATLSFTCNFVEIQYGKTTWFKYMGSSCRIDKDNMACFCNQSVDKLHCLFTKQLLFLLLDLPE